MTDHRIDPPRRETPEAPAPGFWRSRAGIALLVALAVGGLMLGYEHRIHLLGSDWILLLPLLACMGVHFLMHGGHGGHGGSGSGGGSGDPGERR